MACSNNTPERNLRRSRTYYLMISARIGNQPFTLTL
jgi:hypothetical protein